MDKITVNGNRIAFERIGKGLPLLLVHGFPLDHTSWDDIIRLLSEKFEIITPDLRGFGESSLQVGNYSIADLADDMAGLLDRLKIEKTALAGHSMGGYVSLAFAKKYPNRLNALALISSQAVGDTPERKEGRYKTAAEVMEKGVNVVAESMASKFSVTPRVQEYAREVIKKQSQAGVAGALKAMAEREDLTNLVPSFKFPFVLIHGDADALIPIERAKEIKALAPSAQLYELSGVGHFPMKDATEGTAKALIALK